MGWRLRRVPTLYSSLLSTKPNRLVLVQSYIRPCAPLPQALYLPFDHLSWQRMCSDASRTQNTECQYPSCQRGVWQDPDGSYSAYCGASHRDTMRQRSGGLLPVASSVSFCKHCASRPVYIQDGKGTPSICVSCPIIVHLSQSMTSAAFAAAMPSERAQKTQLAPGVQHLHSLRLLRSASSQCARSSRMTARPANPANIVETCIVCQYLLLWCIP